MWHEHVVFLDKLVFVLSVSSDLTNRHGDGRRDGDSATQRDDSRA